MKRSTIGLWLVLLWLALGGLSAGAVAADGKQPPAVPQDPHAHLEQILDRPMYRAWQLRESADLHDVDVPSLGIGEWLRLRMKDLGDLLERLFSRRNRTARSSPSGPSLLPGILKTLAWTIGIAAIVIIIYFLIRSRWQPARSIAVAHVLSRQQVTEAMESGDALALDATQWLDEAQRLMAAQNFRAVYRALYLALLSGLHTAGKIEHNSNRTNWTYVQLYRGPEEERAIFGQLTDVFDRVWYGHKVVAEQSNLIDLRNKVAMLTNARAPG